MEHPPSDPSYGPSQKHSRWRPKMVNVSLVGGNLGAIIAKTVKNDDGVKIAELTRHVVEEVAGDGIWRLYRRAVADLNAEDQTPAVSLNYGAGYCTNVRLADKTPRESLPLSFDVGMSLTKESAEEREVMECAVINPYDSVWDVLDAYDTMPARLWVRTDRAVMWPRKDSERKNHRDIVICPPDDGDRSTSLRIQDSLAAASDDITGKRTGKSKASRKSSSKKRTEEDDGEKKPPVKKTRRRSTSTKDNLAAASDGTTVKPPSKSKASPKSSPNKRIDTQQDDDDDDERKPPAKKKRRKKEQEKEPTNEAGFTLEDEQILTLAFYSEMRSDVPLNVYGFNSDEERCLIDAFLGEMVPKGKPVKPMVLPKSKKAPRKKSSSTALEAPSENAPPQTEGTKQKRKKKEQSASASKSDTTEDGVAVQPKPAEAPPPSSAKKKKRTGKKNDGASTPATADQVVTAPAAAKTPKKRAKKKKGEATSSGKRTTSGKKSKHAEASD